MILFEKQNKTKAGSFLFFSFDGSTIRFRVAY
jgi:hypothetical protein